MSISLEKLMDIKLCGTKFPKTDIKDTPELKKLKMINPTKYRLIAARQLLWTPAGRTLKVKFLPMQSDFKPALGPASDITLLTNTDNIELKGGIKYGKDFDPLQLAFNNELNDTGGETISATRLQNLIIKYIKKCINERWEPFVNLTFTFVEPNQNAEIRFSFITTPGTAGETIPGNANKTLTDDYPTIYNFVGSQNQPTINISSFSISTVLHEFGHALGFRHEHQSPCGRNIEWNKNLLYSWALLTSGWNKYDVDRQIFTPLEKDFFIGSSYDRDSIMIYYYPGELTLNGIGTPKTLRLSPNDCITASLLYPKNPQMTIEKIKELYLQMYPENILSPETKKQFSIRQQQLIDAGIDLKNINIISNNFVIGMYVFIGIIILCVILKYVVPYLKKKFF